jgi:hypothetical protein
MHQPDHGERLTLWNDGASYQHGEANNKSKWHQLETKGAVIDERM